MRIVLGAFLLALPLFAVYESGETWVSQYLDEGGKMERVTGLKLPENWAEIAEFDDVQPRKKLPKLFDWRWRVGGLQPIKNQKTCGSCWAFAVTATLESIIKIKEGEIVDLAEQTLVSRCSNAGDCGGGYFRAFDYVKTPGLPDETQDPYRAQNSSCKKGLKPQERIIRWRYVGSSDRAPSVEQIKTALMEHGPLSVTIHSNRNLTRYRGGIFDNCSNGKINHMVNIEGWNDEKGYWVMRNSWGTGWGENGYARIKFGCNRVAAQAAYATIESKSESVR